MSATWQETIYLQREELARTLHRPMAELAHRCGAAMDDREGLDRVLAEHFAAIPHCTNLYVVDAQCHQVSDTLGKAGLNPDHYGRDRSRRPYMKEPVPEWGFLLSDAYISEYAHRPSITALHRISGADRILGYVGADFDLRDLPVTRELYEETGEWRQIKGDPSIRSVVFQQCRVESPMDRAMEQALSILEELFSDRGVFQAVIHFSSSRATVWVVDDPYRYRLLDKDALADPDICLAYPHRNYPATAVMPQSAVRPVLDAMQGLRLADEMMYLRSASINIFNGMVSLTFSCDGSHYMRYDEFLVKDVSFWTG